MTVQYLSSDEEDSPVTMQDFMIQCAKIFGQRKDNGPENCVLCLKSDHFYKDCKESSLSIPLEDKKVPAFFKALPTSRARQMRISNDFPFDNHSVDHAIRTLYAVTLPKRLVSVELNFCSNMAMMFMPKIYQSNIRNVHLHRICFTPSLFELFTSGVVEMKNLTHLNLAAISILDEDGQRDTLVDSFYSALSSTKILWFRLQEMEWDPWISSFFDNMRYHLVLRELLFANCKFNCDEINYCLNQKQYFPSLTHFSVNQDNPVRDYELEPLLKGCESLEKLELTGTSGGLQIPPYDILSLFFVSEAKFCCQSLKDIQVDLGIANVQSYYSDKPIPALPNLLAATFNIFKDHSESDMSFFLQHFFKNYPNLLSLTIYFYRDESFNSFMPLVIEYVKANKKLLYITIKMHDLAEDPTLAKSLWKVSKSHPTLLSLSFDETIQVEYDELEPDALVHQNANYLTFRSCHFDLWCFCNTRHHDSALYVRLTALLIFKAARILLQGGLSHEIVGNILRCFDEQGGLLEEQFLAIIALAKDRSKLKKGQCIQGPFTFLREVDCLRAKGGKDLMFDEEKWSAYVLGIEFWKFKYFL